MIKRVFSVVGVFLLCVIILGVGTLGFQIAAEGWNLSENLLYAYSGTFGIACAALFMGIFTHIKKIGSDMEERKEKSILKMIMVAIFAVCLLPILADSFIGMALNRFVPIAPNASIEDTIWTLMISIVVAPISEEVLFRKGVYGYTREKFGKAFALITASLIFALFHGYNLQGFFSTLFAGIVLALIYEKSGNIMYSIFAHMMLNIFVNAANYFQSIGSNVYYEVNGYCIYKWSIIFLAGLIAVAIAMGGNLKVGRKVQSSGC